MSAGRIRECGFRSRGSLKRPLRGRGAGDPVVSDGRLGVPRRRRLRRGCAAICRSCRRASTSRSTRSSSFRRSPQPSGSRFPLAGSARSRCSFWPLLPARSPSHSSLLDLESAANVAKLACYALAGFTFLSLFEELWWLTLVAVLVPWVDIWSVAAGPTEYVVEERPGLFEQIAIAFPSPGETAVVNIGPPDILFFALFLAAADRFRLRVDRDVGRNDGLPRRDARARLVLGRRGRPPRAPRRLPRIPPPERRPALARRSPRASPSYRGRLSDDTDSTCGVCGNMSTGRQRSSS